MHRPCFHRDTCLLRLPALLLLVLAMLVSPILTAVGDLHEVGHDEVASVETTGVGNHDEDNEHAEGDLVHAFMHAAHCCGHLGAVFDSAFLAAVHVPVSTMPLPESLAPGPGPRTNVFRPPIAI